MGAVNKTASGNKSFYKLKEDKVDGSPTKGEYRFFKQEKADGRWVAGESFNCLSGQITGVGVTEYEYEGKMKKQLNITMQDVADNMEFTLGLATNAAQSILNTLAGDNGFDLEFICGKPKKADTGKYYPTLYINKNIQGGSNLERRTNWKFQVAELPKVTTKTDDDGNIIKTGVKAAEAFCLDVVKFVQDQLAGNKKPVEQESQEQVKDDDLPF